MPLSSNIKTVSRRVFWPLLFATVFFAIPTMLFLLYPTSFWCVTDNELHGLGNAINMAYRLADHTMYPAPGITWHPGVTFYLMNWLALALAGYPVATGGFSFFKTVIANAEQYHMLVICLAAFVGAAGVYIFARAAQSLVPTGVTILALLLWLTSTPATIMMFLSPGMESFAMLLNGLFFIVLLKIADKPDLSWSTVAFAGGVGALAYLNKLSYVYIPASLGLAICLKIAVCRPGWVRGPALIALFLASLALVVLAVAHFIIGWQGFAIVWEYHKGVILGSGLYGGGDQTVISGNQLRKALTEIPVNAAYAVPIGLIGGIGLAIAGLITARRNAQNISVAILSVGAGAAAALSAIIVLKHYELHYTAGVSATLPACIVAGYLVAKTWRFKIGAGCAIAASLALASSSYVVVPMLAGYVMQGTRIQEILAADRREMDAEIGKSSRTTEFTYKAPFAEFGEGFVLAIAGIPHLSQEYLQMSRRTISSFMARQIKPDVGIYVLDKSYFPNQESVKSARNLDLPEASAPVVIKYEPGDRLIELRTVFLLVRGQ
ncbi:hypothetical protein [Bradyrhizobium sp. S3.9.1]|uniref:hypothetical protein n=1 Tax=Bradyrhizobium sp. S3.9.1 TaxID=3156431 RepID=UPI00339545B7